MKALTLTATGGLQHLVVQDVPAPEIKAPTDVLVRIRAAALNRLDLFVAEGLPGIKYEFPHIPGADAAGVVEAVGPAVRSVRPGDPVMINPALSCGHCEYCRAEDEPLCDTFGILGEHRHGTVAEYIVMPEANLSRKPDAMPWPVAAAFSLATLTAWRMLTTRARVQPGEVVLIWGVGGGVGMAAVQIAKLLGATVIGTSGSSAKLGAARAQGADALINHAEQDVAAEVRRLTRKQGADVIIDSVGEKTWATTLRCLRRGGRVVVCGATTGPMVGLDLRKLFWFQWNILGSSMGSRREYQEIVEIARQGKLWPVVDTVVPLEQSADAFARLAAGEQTGKLVIEVSR